ncbi:MAG: hypothetical protein ACRDJN_15890, partial [Chloroflexota bacterium]
MDALPHLLDRLWPVLDTVLDRLWLKLLSPSMMRLVAPAVGVLVLLAGWPLWRYVGRTALGRAIRWWVLAIGAALFAGTVLYLLAAMPDDPEAAAAVREALAVGLGRT